MSAYSGGSVRLFLVGGGDSFAVDGALVAGEKKGVFSVGLFVLKSELGKTKTVAQKAWGWSVGAGEVL